MPNLSIPLEIDGVEFKTLLPDGTQFYSTNSSPHCNTIAEKKQIIWSMSVKGGFDLEGVNIWCQFAMFQQGIINSLNAKLPITHAITFPVGLATGIYPMGCIVNIGASFNLNNNAQLYLQILTGYTFNIIAEFYQIYDERTYQSQTLQDNHAKLLRDVKGSAFDLVSSVTPSCYNSGASSWAFTARLEKPNVLFAPDPFPYTMNSNPGIGGTWYAGFYNKSSNNGAPYFNNPIWEFTRSTISVSNLSASVNTDVLFKITSPGGVSKVLFWIIRTDKFDNTDTMFGNYEANFEDIINTNTNIGVDKLTTPVINVTSIGGGVYKVGCSIAANKLTNNATYRMIAVVYEKTDYIYYSNSFISEELTCDSSPCYVGGGFEAIGSIDDYNREFRGNDLECCIEERMRSKIKLLFPFDQWKNELLARLGLTSVNDIRRYLTSVNVEIYDEEVVPIVGIVKNVYDSKTSVKYGVNLFSAQPGMTLTFSSAWAELVYEWRNRFESNVPCISTTVNGTPVFPVNSYQYWGGKTIKIKWTLKFYYDDYFAPFEDTIEFDQQIRVKDYGNMTVLHDKVDGVRSAFNDTVNVCKGEEFCMAGVLDSIDSIDRKLMVNVYPEYSGLNGLNEAEVWVGNQLPQMTTNIVTNEDEDYSIIYSQKAARFCVDTSKLSVNSYNISALAKKYVDTGYRVSEKTVSSSAVLETRITETVDKRITE